MNKSKVVTIVVGGIAAGCVGFVVFLLVLKALWGWVVPDLFPGAVQQGLVAATISWGTAAKVAILVAVLSGIAGGQHSGGKS